MPEFSAFIQAAEIVTDPMALVTSEGHLRALNSAARKLLNESHEFVDQVVDAASFLKYLEQATSSTDPLLSFIHLRDHHGQQHSWAISASRFSHGEEPLVVFRLSSATEEAAQVVKEGDLERLRGTALDALPAQVALLDRTGLIVTVNAAWKQNARDRRLGIGSVGEGENFLAACMARRSQGEDHVLQTALGVRAVLAGDTRRFQIEYPWDAADQSRWCSLSVTPLNGQQGAAGAVLMMLDITQSKQLQASLSGANARFERTLASVSDLFATFDSQWRYTFLNEKAAAFFGRDPKELLGKSIWDVNPHLVGSTFYQELQEAYFNQSNRTFEQFDAERERWYEHRVYPAPISIALFSSDVTERKQADLALRESEERLRLAINAAHMGSWDWDLATNRVSWITPDLDGLGADETSLPNTFPEFLKLIHPEDRGRVEDSVQRALKNRSLIRVEYRIPRGQGAWRWIEAMGQTYFDEKGKPIRIRGVVQDITDRKSTEEQLRHSQKMEAVGQLAGGVAHDFNNLLTVIGGYGEILQYQTPPESPMYEALYQIRKSAERAASLTRHLLSFSRRQILQPVILDLNTVVTDLQKMLRRLIGEDIELETKLDPNLGPIRGDPGQLEQILLNLALNARDAMPKGGTLTLQTKNVTIDESFVGRDPNLPFGDFVCIKISDTGVGIPESIRHKLFEPFFTTKEFGRGSGLGLPIVHGIVQQSDGHIRFDSEVGKGTTFTIYLPRIQRQNLRAAPSLDLKPPRGTETILLAEDESGVRSLAKLCLEAQGYTVLEATNGSEALELATKHTGPLHFLLTDVIMPHRNGRELADEVLKLHPNIVILFVSGYTDDSVVRNGIVSTRDHFLQKPFTPFVLIRRVRELLDAKNKNIQGAPV